MPNAVFYAAVALIAGSTTALDVRALVALLGGAAWRRCLALGGPPDADNDGRRRARRTGWPVAVCGRGHMAAAGRTRTSRSGATWDGRMTLYPAWPRIGGGGAPNAAHDAAGEPDGPAYTPQLALLQDGRVGDDDGAAPGQQRTALTEHIRDGAVAGRSPLWRSARSASSGLAKGAQGGCEVSASRRSSWRGATY